MEFKIENGILTKCNLQENERSVTIPSGVRTIGRYAFWGSHFVEEFIIPDGVESIEDSGFCYCKTLKRVVLPESLKYIGKRAFSDCESLEEIRIPEGVLTIGDGAFEGCLELGDENNCIVVNKTFYGFSDYNHLQTKWVIPDGTEIIEGDLGCRRFVEFPDSVRKIKNCTQLEGTRYNIPKGYLQQTSKLEELSTLHLLKTPSWRKQITERDVAALLLFQSAKKLRAEIETSYIKDPEKILEEMCDILTENKKTVYFTRAVEFYFEQKGQISDETVNKLYQVAKNAKAKKAVELLEAHIAKETAYKTVNKTSNETERFCRENFEEDQLNSYLDKIGISSNAFENVKYRDSDETASGFVVKCALVPYMKQLRVKPKEIREYENAYCIFQYDNAADRVAADLDRESLQRVLDIFLSEKIPAAPEVLVPYGRFASREQISVLKEKCSLWEEWKKYKSNGRKAIIIAHGAILLNETRDALLFADEFGALKEMAKLRGMTEDGLRDFIMCDFGFSRDGEKYYDLGGKTVKIILKKDFTLELFDVKKGKFMKTISRAGNDPDRTDAAKKDLQEMKENIPVVRENRIRILLKEYLHPVRRRTADWMKTYMDNPVLRILVEPFVWTAEKEDGTSLQFMLREDGKIINRNGAEITLQDSFRIFLSNPCNMDEEELMQWRRHLMDDSVVQPFHQMFENVYSFSDKERLRNRYLDMEIRVHTGMKEYLQKNSARIEEYGDGGYIISIGHNAINVGGYSPHESLKTLEECWGSLELYKVSADCFTYRNPEKNHFIHIMDELCFKEAIYGGDTEKMEMLKDFLNERIALELIEFIKGKEINEKQQKSLNWLTDYYNALHAR